MTATVFPHAPNTPGRYTGLISNSVHVSDCVAGVNSAGQLWVLNSFGEMKYHGLDWSNFTTDEQSRNSL